MAIITGTNADETLNGTVNDDVITGLEGADTLNGIDGNDYLDGGTGADHLYGGLGDDTYVFDDLGDGEGEINGQGHDLILTSVSHYSALEFFMSGQYRAGIGIDDITLTGSSNITGYGNANANVITGNSGANTLFGYEGNDLLEGLAGNDFLYGHQGDDTLNGGGGNDAMYGGNGNDTFHGSAGSDSLFGGEGDDYLSGGADADTLDGGEGSDTYVVDDLSDLVIETGTVGIDLVESEVNFTLGATLENLTLTGTGNSDAIGNALDNTLIGNAGANLIDGGAGTDILDGGLGNDTYVIDKALDTITENANAGIDSVRVSFNLYHLGANLENLVLSGTIDTGYGNTLDNAVTGNAANNILFGLEGNDTVVGLSGDDYLHGYLGNDVLDGGEGVDELIGGLGDDSYYTDGLDTVTENIGEGTDSAYSKARSAYLADNVENLNMLNTETGLGVFRTGNGNSLDNEIVDNDYDGQLFGYDGNDSLFGNGGDDLLSGLNGDDFINGGEGNDSGYGGLGVDEIYGQGGNDTLYGNEGNDLLFGDSGTDTVYGGAGEDVLDGGLGADVMDGGDGEDTYYVDDSGDLINDTGDVGSTVIDIVYTAATTYTMGYGLNWAYMSGSGDISVIGNSEANIIFGNDGNNLSDGGGSAFGDWYYGGLGNDTYFVRSIFDYIWDEGSAEGTDTVIAYSAYTGGGSSFTLDLYLENLTLRGSLVTGIGNTAANIISGNELANDLQGLSGNDTLIGGLGADTLTGGSGIDIASYELATSGVTAKLNVSADNTGEAAGDVYSSIEGLIGSNFNDILWGNGAANTLKGLDGDDKLNGQVGVDTLYGGSGNDTYYVDDIGDVVSEETTLGVDDGGIDRIVTTVDFTLPAYIENISISVISARTITGNSLNNVMQGNVSLDTLLGDLGDDTLIGGLGADVLVGGRGFDVASYEDSTAGLTASLGAPVGNTGEAAGDSYSSIEGLIGSNFDDTLNGNSAANVLKGGRGADRLNGSGGADTLFGGAGSDLYFVDNVGDIVSEETVIGVDDGGTDRVVSSISYTLGDLIEALSLNGSSDTTGTGNGLNNTITGNTGNNTLYGMAGGDILNGNTGIDTMYGGSGDDTYYIDQAGDVAHEDTVSGIDDGGLDRVYASIDYTMGDFIERLYMTGSANISGVGNDLANRISGNSGGNALTGGLGNDLLYGGDGDDTYIFGANFGIDTISDTSGADRIQFSADFTAADLIIEVVGADTYYAISDGVHSASRCANRIRVIGGAAGGVIDFITFASPTPAPAAMNSNSLAQAIIGFAEAEVTDSLSTLAERTAPIAQLTASAFALSTKAIA